MEGKALELLKLVVLGVLGIVFLQAIPAAVAFALNHFGRGISATGRVILSAFACGLLMVLIPTLAILSNDGALGEKLLPLASMLVGAVFMSVYFVPGAWWMTRRLERRERPDADAFG